MRIDIRPVSRLRGPSALDIPAVLGPVADALAASAVDLSTVRVTCDWVQYRANFREAVECRPVLADHVDQLAGALGGAPAETGLEIAVDLRRCGESDVRAAVSDALAGHADPGLGSRTVLEPWGPASGSCVWRFNTLYWQALSRWEEFTGRPYEQALPGGRSEAGNVEAVRERIFELLRVWDELDARRALPGELYVVEFGVGNGNQARTWLDVFADLDRAHGRDYYRRLHYLMGDYSAHVLERARAAVAHHGGRVSALVLEATRPQVSLGFLRGKAFAIYISNTYDNLPCDEVAAIAGRPYLVQVRAWLGKADAKAIAAAHRTTVPALPALVERLLRLGPDLLSEADPERFPGPEQAVALWRDVWAAVRLQERYVPLPGLDAYPVSSSVTGEILRPLLESGGDVRMHVSNGALASFTETLPLLHPFGALVCSDLFVTEPAAYGRGFYGPGKYDGSVVNWVNGPLLRLAALRRGYSVAIGSSRGQAGNVKTLTAQVRD